MSKQKSLILLTKGVKEYRATIPQYVCKNDVVLEIGFAWGTTTHLLSQQAHRAVGIDKGESYYKAVQMYPHLELYKIDGFDMKSVLEPEAVEGETSRETYVQNTGYMNSVFTKVQWG